VTTANMQFVQGQTNLGFGTGDVAVRRLWVVSPTEAWANVTVSPNALQRNTAASVISGFQVYEQPQGFQVLPASSALPVIGLPVPNAFYPVLNSLYPGALASIYGLHLASGNGPVMLTIGGQRAQVLYTSATQINFVIPAGLPIGPAMLFLNNGVMSGYPVVVQINPPPPAILSVATETGEALNASAVAASGDIIVLTVSGMDPAVVSAPGRVAVFEGGVSIPAFTILPPQEGATTLQIQFALAASVTGQQLPLTVSLDGDLGMPFYINVAAAGL